jgi:hypothetical protein
LGTKETPPGPIFPVHLTATFYIHTGYIVQPALVGLYRKNSITTAKELHATSTSADDSNTARSTRSESEVMTAMEKATNDKDRFTMTELAALRNDLLQGGMIDSYEAAELLQVFLMGRGYGVSPKAALDAAGRVEMAGCALPVLMFELENLAMVM